MMARRAAQDIGIVHDAIDHGIHGREDRSGAQPRNLKGASTAGRQCAHVATAASAHGFEVIEMRPGMDGQQVRIFGNSGRDVGECVMKAADVDQVLQPPLRLCVFEVLAGLHRHVRFEEAGPVLCVVPEAKLGRYPPGSSLCFDD